MRNVILYMSMSLDGFVESDREHPGMAVTEGAELTQWKLERISEAGAHLMGRVCLDQGRRRRGRHRVGVAPDSPAPWLWRI